jgi:hypothetical protein
MLQKLKIVLLVPILVLTALATRGQKTQKVATGRIPGSNCDNISLADPSPDMQMRPPSECETAFHSHVWTIMKQAFAKVFTWAADHHWMVGDTASRPLKQVNKQSENYFFNSDLNYQIELLLDPASAEYGSYRGKYGVALEQYKNAPGDSTYRNFWRAAYDVNAGTIIRINTYINQVSSKILFFKDGYKVFNVPGAAYAVKGPFAQLRTGGGVEDSQEACIILFGKVAVKPKKNEDGGFSIYSETHFPKAPHLTVQQMAVRIECNRELLSVLLKEIDFKVLASLLDR